MPAPFEKHVFVCLNERAKDNPKGDCHHKGAPEVFGELKKRVAEEGLRGRVRVNRAGCLDQCAKGCSIVVYPEGVWYGGVKPSDVDEIVQSHLKGGAPVERLVTVRGGTTDNE